MFRTHLLALAAACSVAALPAHAIGLVGVDTGGAVTVADYGDAGLMSFDIDFSAVTFATLTYRIDAADLTGMGLSLNAVLRNLSGSGFGAYTLSLDKGSFDAGTVTRQFGGSTQVSAAGAEATLMFDSPEFLDVEVGNPLGSAGALDWTIEGLAAGDRVSLTVTALPVPEPGTYALLLSGLGVVGWLARRRRADR